MRVYSEVELMDFEAWSGGADTLEELTSEELNLLQEVIEELYPEGLTDTQLNDILWFEDEWIGEVIGRELFQ